MVQSYEEAEALVSSLPNDSTSEYNSGKLVHFETKRIFVPPDNRMRDIDFAIEAEGALKLTRNVEYCQWTEHFTERREKYEDREVVTRQYYYLLGWHSTRFPSMLFDQPFAHHNPQRDPFPGYNGDASSVQLGDSYVLPKEIIQKGFYDTKGMLFDQHSLGGFVNSIAAGEGFRYIGNGYFYSAYEQSGAEFLARLAGRALEGSLDIQLGDFFASCKAGDIRVHFTAAAPKVVSVVAKQTDIKGTLGFYVAEINGYNVGMIHEGSFSAKDMFAREIKSFFNWYVLVSRGLLFIWALIIQSFVFNVTETWVLFSTSLFAAGAVDGAILSLIWGVNTANLTSFLLFTISAAAFFAITPPAFYQQRWSTPVSNQKSTRY
eukprot:TRINITY_DN9804_c0_g1_i2.p1 TRINITY_DN9804_c0_g1~~TRINITY_DN9804_c0_g1_i2.p1  ORF type:complete len:376 (+),score=53.76 TRINITY_DN9804_c0_g1_i2:134-1261(+)